VPRPGAASRAAGSRSDERMRYPPMKWSPAWGQYDGSRRAGLRGVCGGGARRHEARNRDERGTSSPSAIETPHANATAAQAGLAAPATVRTPACPECRASGRCRTSLPPVRPTCGTPERGSGSWLRNWPSGSKSTAYRERRKIPSNKSLTGDVRSDVLACLSCSPRIGWRKSPGYLSPLYKLALSFGCPDHMLDIACHRFDWWIIGRRRGPHQHKLERAIHFRNNSNTHVLI
jgi:hypothetical protein